MINYYSKIDDQLMQERGGGGDKNVFFQPITFIGCVIFLHLV